MDLRLSLAAARRGEAAVRRRAAGMSETTATAVRGSVGHMLRVLLDNLDTKSRTYKSKVGGQGLCCFGRLGTRPEAKQHAHMHALELTSLRRMGICSEGSSRKCRGLHGSFTCKEHREGT